MLSAAVLPFHNRIVYGHTHGPCHLLTATTGPPWCPLAPESPATNTLLGEKMKALKSINLKGDGGGFVVDFFLDFCSFFFFSIEVKMHLVLEGEVDNFLSVGRRNSRGSMRKCQPWFFSFFESQLCFDVT